MTLRLNHLHMKSQDPQQAAQWYVDNLGAKIVSQSGPASFQLDLHGLPLNLTPFMEGQTRKQFYGMEHIALNSDDMEGDVAKLKATGARVLDELVASSGRKVVFFEGPDGVQLEVVEAVK